MPYGNLFQSILSFKSSNGQCLTVIGSCPSKSAIINLESKEKGQTTTTTTTTKKLSLTTIQQPKQPKKKKQNKQKQTQKQNKTKRNEGSHKGC